MPLLPEREDVNPRDEGYEDTIINRLGDVNPWHLTWDPGNWLKIRASKEWVYGIPITPEPALEAAPGEEAQVKPAIHDGDHILLFPMDQDGLCPQAWFEAAWPFLEHFRSNFCFYPHEAFMYKNVTLIGPPLGSRRGVAQEVEDALKSMSWRGVERIWCTSAADLKSALDGRIAENMRFRGQDELAPEADPD